METTKADNTAIIAKAKNWEIGTVRKVSGTDGNGTDFSYHQLVLSPDVKIMVGNREVAIDPQYRNIRFNSVDDQIEFKKKLANDGVISLDQVSKFEEIAAARNITQVLVAKLK